MINEMEWMDRIHMLILQTCDLIFFLIAVIILILFCVYFICISDSCVCFFLFHFFSFYFLFVRSVLKEFERVKNSRGNECVHGQNNFAYNGTAFRNNAKKMYAMWPFQGRENDHQILFSTFHQSYQNHRISLNFAVFRSFNRNT